MTDTDRVEPPRIAGERTMLAAWLDYWRASILHKCAGLSASQLVSKSCPPSPFSMIGLVRHLTEMERGYAHRLSDPSVPLLYCTDASPDGDFEDISEASAFADIEVFTVHCVRSREIMDGLGLDDEFGKDSRYSVRWVYHYLAKEYARHLGHADLLRERIDGAVGE